MSKTDSLTGLPERLEVGEPRAMLVGGDNENIFIDVYYDSDTAMAEAFAAEIRRRYNAHEKMREALAGLFNMIESGVLVRDISHDADPKWYLKAMELTQALGAAQQALAAIAADDDHEK